MSAHFCWPEEFDLDGAVTDRDSAGRNIQRSLIGAGTTLSIQYYKENHGRKNLVYSIGFGTREGSIFSRVLLRSFWLQVVGTRFILVAALGFIGVVAVAITASVLVFIVVVVPREANIVLDLVEIFA